MKYWFLLFIILSGYAVAQSFPVATDRIKTGTLNENTAGNDTAEGGNVTLLNLTMKQSTDRWQGYFGNVSGSLSLGLGSNVFFDFSSAIISSVFASPNASFDFTSLAAGNAAAMDTVWGYATGQDQAQDIYMGTTDIEGVSAPSIELEPVGTDWNSTICNNGASLAKESYAFGVNVQEPAVSCFDGTECEYELMVPADGTEVYYFFMVI